MRDQGVPCTVTFEKGFDAQVDRLRKDFPRIDEMVRGAEWAIARSELRGDIKVGLYAGAGGPYLIVEATVGEEVAIAVKIGRQ